MLLQLIWWQYAPLPSGNSKAYRSNPHIECAFLRGFGSCSSGIHFMKQGFEAASSTIDLALFQMNFYFVGVALILPFIHRLAEQMDRKDQAKARMVLGEVWHLHLLPQCTGLVEAHFDPAMINYRTGPFERQIGCLGK